MDWTTRKRRILRRFFLAAVLAASSAQAQQPIAAVQPVVDMVLTAEAELSAGLRAADAPRLKRLAWSSMQAAFALVRSDPPMSPDDPVATALRNAWVACADSHSTISMLASGAVQVLITNIGGDNTKVENEANRDSFDFFLKPYGEQRRRCAARSGLALPPMPIAAKAAQVVPAFQQVRTKTLSPDDRTEMVRMFNGMAAMEQSLPGIVRGDDPEPVRASALDIMAFRRFLYVRDDPDMPRRDYFVFKECRWAVGHFGQILAEIHEALIRPDIRSTQLDSARNTLGQYRQTKADCAAALRLPVRSGLVDMSDDALK